MNSMLWPQPQSRICFPPFGLSFCLHRFPGRDLGHSAGLGALSHLEQALLGIPSAPVPGPGDIQAGNAPGYPRNWRWWEPGGLRDGSGGASVLCCHTSSHSTVGVSCPVSALSPETHPKCPFGHSGPCGCWCQLLGQPAMPSERRQRWGEEAPASPPARWSKWVTSGQRWGFVL